MQVPCKEHVSFLPCPESAQAIRTRRCLPHAKYQHTNGNTFLEACLLPPSGKWICQTWCPYHERRRKPYCRCFAGQAPWSTLECFGQFNLLELDTCMESMHLWGGPRRGSRTCNSTVEIFIRQCSHASSAISVLAGTQSVDRSWESFKAFTTRRGPRISDSGGSQDAIQHASPPERLLEPDGIVGKVVSNCLNKKACQVVPPEIETSLFQQKTLKSSCMHYKMTQFQNVPCSIPPQHLTTRTPSSLA